MKRISSFTAIALGLLPVSSTFLHGTELFSDDFAYADGSLTSNAKWARFSGTVGDLLVSGGQAVVQHGTPSEDAQAVFT